MTTENGNGSSGGAEPTGDELVADYMRMLEHEAERLVWTARQELVEDVRSHIEVARAEAEASVPDRVTVERILASLGDPVEIVDEAAMGEPQSAPPPPRQDEVPPANPYGTSGGPGYGDTSQGYHGYGHPEPDNGPPYPLGGQEIGALTLLLFGGFVFVIGWFIGLVLLWTSRRWDTRDKLIGTFLPPGGLVVVGWLMTFGTSSRTCAQQASGMFGGPVQCTTSGLSMPEWLGLPVVVLLLALPFLTARYLRNRAARVRPENWGQSRGRRDGRGGLIFGLVGAFALLAVIVGGAALTAGSSGGNGNGPQPAPVSSNAVPVPIQSSGSGDSMPPGVVSSSPVLRT